MTDYSIIFVIVNTFVVIKLCRCEKVHKLLKILLCVSFFGWNAAPALLMYIPQLFGRSDVVTDAYIQCSYYNEIYLFFAYNIAYYLIKNKGLPKPLLRLGFQDSPRVLSTLTVFSIFLSLYKLFSVITSTTSYYEGNNLDNISALGPLDFLAGYALSFLFVISFFFKGKVSPTYFKLSTAIAVLYFFVLTLRGGRIYIFGVVILLIYHAISSARQRGAKNLLLAGVVGAVALMLLPILASVRGDEQVKINDVIQASSSQDGGSVMGEILGKTNSVMYGSYLVERDGIGRWNGMMYASTVFALIPRFIFPYKPEPGSVNGTQEGLPARASAIYSTKGDYNGITNNGVPSSISSLWGGGWLAYIIELLFTAFLIYIINGVFVSQKPIFNCFVFYLISFPTGVLEVPLPTILISIQRFAVLYFVLYLLFITKRMNKQLR